MPTTQPVSCADQWRLLCSRILFSSLFSPLVNVKGSLSCGGMLRGKRGRPLQALLARSWPLSHHWAAGGLLRWIRLLTAKHLAVVFRKAQLAWRLVPPTMLTTSELSTHSPSSLPLAFWFLRLPRHPVLRCPAHRLLRSECSPRPAILHGWLLPLLQI